MSKRKKLSEEAPTPTDGAPELTEQELKDHAKKRIWGASPPAEAISLGDSYADEDEEKPEE